MKPCKYCGHENEDAALYCVECRTEFESKEAIDPKLTDPAAALVPVAEFGDLIHAGLLKDELEAAGIAACIPEDMSANPFGQFMPLASFTVQVAASDYDVAKRILEAHSSLSSPKDAEE